MPLPTIATPTFELTLPSNGKKIKYRPFLVKEEKVLILALESQDTKDITRAIKDTLKKLGEINIQHNEELDKVAILKDQKNQLEIEKKRITTSLQSLEEENLKLRSQINELKKDYETSKRKENQFNEKIDELNQETDNLLEEIDKWQL